MKIKKSIIITSIILLIISLSNTVYGLSTITLNANSSKKIYKGGNYSQSNFKEFVKNKENWTKSAQLLYNRLIKEGATPVGACAMLGNITAESRFSTKENKNGFGILNWKGNRGFQAKNKNITFNRQTNYMINELKNIESYKKIWNKLANSKEKDLISTTEYIKTNYIEYDYTKEKRDFLGRITYKPEVKKCDKKILAICDEFAVDWYNYFICKDTYIVVNDNVNSVLKSIGGQKGDQDCLEYSEKYSKKLLNNQSASFKTIGGNDKKIILKVAASEIQNGRPVIARVIGLQYTQGIINKVVKDEEERKNKYYCRHFVTIVRN